MPGADNSSFQQGEEGFSGIGRSPRTIRILALKFFVRMIDGLMFLPLLQGMAITGVLVRVDDCFLAHAFGQSRAEIFLGHRGHHFHTGQSQTLNQCDHRGLAAETGSGLPFAANEGFVHFDRSL